LTVAIQENGEAVTDDFNKRASELNGVLQKAREVGRGLLGQVANSPYSTVQQAQSLEAQFKSSVDTTKAKIVKDGNRTSQSNVII
jgi:predicted GIY-YIG superfamily endonuclease